MRNEDFSFLEDHRTAAEGFFKEHRAAAEFLLGITWLPFWDERKVLTV